MSNLNELKPVGTLNPFGKFCCTIGNLPASYMMSLTYEEQLLWFCNFLENTVIPAINNNAEAILELQNFLANLDLQNEVNNKLDEMAEDGTLANIINQEVFGNLNDEINEINENLSNNTTIMIGDSYGVGSSGGVSGATTGWCDLLKTKMNLPNNEYYKFVKGGAGFCSVSNNSFQDLLQNNISSVTDKNKVKNIIVCGGYNDNSFNVSQIQSAISNFVTYCKTNFPNAHIYIGMIANSSAISNAIRVSIKMDVLCGYISACGSNNVTYLSGVENILNRYSLFSDDEIHPNDTGYGYLASGIYQALTTGYCSVSYSGGFSCTITNSLFDSSQTNYSWYAQVLNNILSIWSAHSTNIYFTTPQTITSDFLLGTFSCSLYRDISDNMYIPVIIGCFNSDDTFVYGGNAYLYFKDGNIYLKNGDWIKSANQPTDIVRLNMNSFMFNTSANMS